MGGSTTHGTRFSHKIDKLPPVTGSRTCDGRRPKNRSRENTVDRSPAAFRSRGPPASKGKDVKYKDESLEEKHVALVFRVQIALCALSHVWVWGDKSSCARQLTNPILTLSIRMGSLNVTISSWRRQRRRTLAARCLDACDHFNSSCRELRPSHKRGLPPLLLCSATSRNVVHVADLRRHYFARGGECRRLCAFPQITPIGHGKKVGASRTQLGVSVFEVVGRCCRHSTTVVVKDRIVCRCTPLWNDTAAIRPPKRDFEPFRSVRTVGYSNCVFLIHCSL